MPDNQQQDRINFLAKKWREGTISPEEKKEFDAWYDSKDNTFELTRNETRGQTENRLYNNILEKGNIQKRRTVRLWPRIAAAASIIVALSICGYFMLHQQQGAQQVAQNKNDIAPGGNKATLTLSDGKKIILSDARNGKIASQGQILVNKTADGQVEYQNAAGTQNNAGEVAWNTLEVPRGGQYHLTLIDGTQVWLNSGSKLVYPSAFMHGERRVELTGEAYFEVVHNAAQPFSVKVKDEIIEDIGTHFNINAYDDEPVLKTTLIEGAVRVSEGSQQVMLRPGQASIGGIEGKVGLITADPEEAIAWKSGYFLFNSENLASIMRKVSRWYNADVVFEDKKLEKQLFSGTITVSRFKNVSDLLNKLRLTGAAHFKIENNKILISD